MLNWLLNLRIDQLPFLATVDVLSICAAIYLLVRKPTGRWMVTAAVAILAGIGFGYLVSWLVGDVFNVFGVALSASEQGWVAAAFAGVALAIVNLWRSRWWRKVIAIVSIPLFLITGGAYVNLDVGAYRDLSDALGINPFSAGSLGYETGNAGTKDAPVVKDWKPPTAMPATGKVVSAAIPGTVSHFSARPAVIYLPPAALVPHPPVLPVLIIMSGQPGSPFDQFTSGHIDQYMDSYAAAHEGLAPIVVSPDQLGAENNNPMCVDSPLGNSATYITVDVIDWIRAHLRVGTARSAWAVGGFSQGATCAVQFEAGYPKLFGSLLAISSELAPTNGPNTVAQGFHGSQAAYTAASPLTLMKKNAPFRDTIASFAVGANDSQYRPWALTLSAAAAKSGMTTHLYISPGTTHDWYTVQYGYKYGFPPIAAHMGVG